MFWDLTPRQFARECVAYLRQTKAESERAHSGRAWLAWHLAAWIRPQGSKGLPSLDKVIGSKLPTRKQSAKEQVALWQTFAACVGGKFVPVTAEEAHGR